MTRPFGRQIKLIKYLVPKKKLPPAPPPPVGGAPFTLPSHDLKYTFLIDQGLSFKGAVSSLLTALAIFG